MGIFDARYDLARQQAGSSQSGVTTLSDVMSGNGGFGRRQVAPLSGADAATDPLAALRQQATTMFQDTQRQKEAQQIALGQQHPSGLKGLLADVMSNPIVKTALKPLEILDIPRRAIISTVKEVGDLVTGNDASLSDWWKQTKDPTFGFGKIIPKSIQEKAGVWGSRVLGFLGDVALDPMTHIGLGGGEASRVLGAAGKEMRIVAAERLIEKGATAERAMEVARKGLGYLTAEERTMLGLERQGMYFMGKRIAGSGSVAELLQKTPSRMRIMLGDTVLGRKAGELFDPQVMQEARRALLRGTAPPELAKDYFNFVIGHSHQRAAYAQAAREWSKQVTDMLTTLSPEELAAARTSAHKVIEKVVGVAASDADNAVANKFTTMFESMWQNIAEDYKLIDPEGGFGKIDNYFPHMRTDAAKVYMSNPDNAFVKDLHSIISNPVETVGPFKHRLKVGDKFFDHVLTEEDVAGGVARLNEIATKAGFKGQFFETDAVKVMASYVNQFAEQKGIAAFAKHLWDKGTMQAILETQHVDEKALNQIGSLIEKQARKYGKSMDKAHDSVSTVLDEMRKVLDVQHERLGMQASDAEELLSFATSRGEQAAVARRRAAVALDEATNELQQARGLYREVLGEHQNPMVLDALTARHESAVQDLQRLRERITSAEAFTQENLSEIDRLSGRLRSIREEEKFLRDLGNVAEEMMNMAVAGKRMTTGFHEEAMGVRLAADVESATTPAAKAQAETRLKAFNKQTTAMRKAIRGSFEDNLKIAGSMEDVIPKTAATQEWWGRITKTAPITVNDVRDLNWQRVNAIALSAAAGEANIRDMRLASAWLMARQVHIYGGIEQLPESIARVLYSSSNEVLSGIADLPIGLLDANGLLEQAARAEQMFTSMARNTRWLKEGAALERVATSLGNVYGEVEQHARTYLAAQDVLENSTLMSGMLAQSDVQVPMEALQRLVGGSDSPLANLFTDVFDFGAMSDAARQSEIEALMQPDNIGSYDRYADITRSDYTSLTVVDGADAGTAAAEQAMPEASKGITFGELQSRLQSFVDNGRTRVWDISAKSASHNAMLISAGAKSTEAGSRFHFVDIADAMDKARRAGLKIDTSGEYGKIVDAAGREGRIAGTSNNQQILEHYLQPLRDAHAKLRSDLQKYSTIKLTGKEVRAQQQVMDDVRNALADRMQHLWFASAVEERWKSAHEVMGMFGLVPTETHLRNIVNSVAEHHMASLNATADVASSVLTSMKVLRERVGEAGSAVEARRIVREGLDEIAAKYEGSSQLLATFGGESYSSELLSKWNRLGGVDKKNGAMRAANDARREAGLTEVGLQRNVVKSLRKKVREIEAYGSASPELTGLRTQLAREESLLKQKEVEAVRIMDENPTVVANHQAASKKYDDFVENELRPWFKKVTGTKGKPSKDTMYEYLKMYSQRVDKHWEDVSSTHTQIGRWMDDVLAKLGDNTRVARRRRMFYRTAADPFVDASQILVDPFTRQTLPSMYASKLEDLALQIDHRLATLRAAETEGTRLTALAQETSVDAKSLMAKQRAMETGRGIGNAELWGDNAALAKRARQVQVKLDEMQNSVEYLSARQQRSELDLRSMLAEFDHNNQPLIPHTTLPAVDQARDYIRQGREVTFEYAKGVKGKTGKLDTVEGFDQWLATHKGGVPQGTFHLKAVNAAEFSKIEARQAAIESEIRLAENELSSPALTKFAPSSSQAKSAAAQRAAVEQYVARLKEELSKMEQMKAQQFVPISDMSRQFTVDGQVLQFTPEEFRALNEVHPQTLQVRGLISQRDQYQQALAGLYQRRAQVGRNVNNAAASEAGVLERNIAELESRIAGINKQVSGMAPVMNLQHRQQWLQNSRSELAAMQKQLAEVGTDRRLEREIKKMQAHINQLEQDITVHHPDTLIAAESKLRKLQKAMHDGNASMETVRDAMRKVYKSSTSVDARREFIDGLWNESHSSKVLAQYDALSSSAEQEFRTLLYQHPNAIDKWQAYKDAVDAEFRRAYVALWDFNGPIGAVDNRIFAPTGLETLYNEASDTVANANAALDAGNAPLHSYTAQDPFVRPKVKQLKSGRSMTPLAESQWYSSVDGLPEKLQADAQLLREARPNASPAFLRTGADGKPVYGPPLGPLARTKYDAQFTNFELQRRMNNFDWINGEPTPSARGLVHGFGAPVTPEVAKKAQLPIAEEAVARTARAIDESRAAWGAQHLADMGEAKALVVDAAKRKIEAGKQFVAAKAEFDAASTFSAEVWDEIFPRQLQQRIDSLSEHLKTLTPDRLPTGEIDWRNATPEILELQSIVDDSQKALDTLAEQGVKTEPLQKLIIDANNKLLAVSASRNEVNLAWNMLNPLPDGTFAWEKIISNVEDGWTRLVDMGLPNTMMRTEMWTMLQNMRRINNPAASRELLRFLNPYTKFFKAYATLSPGFHVRNALSNTIALTAAGADIRLFRRSFKLAAGFMEHFDAGTLETFYKGMSDAERSVFDVALKAAEGAGGGRISDQLGEILGQGGNKLYNNAATQLSGRIGHKVEFTGRFMLAYDTVVQGMKAGEKVGTLINPEELFAHATARVKRHLFDYVDISAADEAVKQIVPFWIWMSRNVPLQIVNQWVNPRAYSMYASLVRNIGQDDSGKVVPAWLKESGGFNVGGDWYATPDMGQNRMQQVLSELGDPARMGSYVNPMLRVPVELLGGRRLYNNVPFSSSPQEVTGGPAQPLIEALLGLAGATHEAGPNGVKDGNGNLVIPAGTATTSDKWNYALMNLFPMLSQSERLVPATEGYKAKQAASWLSYLGIPVRELTPQMRDAEVARRQKQMQQLASSAKKLGYTP